ncbi:MAG TPA: glycosyltransferase [Baekduia sp.]|uniref:glycosyltransferase n=1 Tax=Baekduia sp. TaxID=2600305 RepID=UPI002D792042|nr:glycosyltransferase [Baekduia sp.]HET6508243.1 glycosyltransferase [Baekduia sp.]
MTDADRRRVLVIIQGEPGDKPAGPEIRGWEIAKAFATRHDVTVIADVAGEQVREGIRLVPRTRRRLVREALRHDVVVGPLLPPFLLLAVAARRQVRVADLYDPVDLELSTLGSGWKVRRLTAQRRKLRQLQLRSADIVVCANEPQRERAVADLAGVRRGDGGPELTLAGMGLPEAPDFVDEHPLRDRFAAIGADDPLVLWWGSVWRWLDAGTAIRAIERLAERRPDVRFVITVGPPPNELTATLNAADEARQLARERGLEGRHVFFLEEWVPYARRDRYLRDADAGLTLHASADESPLAARARYMDYIWAGLPSVLARGDVVADQMARAGAATLVEPGDVEATADALDALLGDADARRAASAAALELADELRWSALLAPLVDSAERLATRGGSIGDAMTLAASAAGFYARRAVNLCLGVS